MQARHVPFVPLLLLFGATGVSGAYLAGFHASGSEGDKKDAALEHREPRMAAAMPDTAHGLIKDKPIISDMAVANEGLIVIEASGVKDDATSDPRLSPSSAHLLKLVLSTLQRQCREHPARTITLNERQVSGLYCLAAESDARDAALTHKTRRDNVSVK
jgi:hypothetical protein